MSNENYKITKTLIDTGTIPAVFPDQRSIVVAVCIYYMNEFVKLDLISGDECEMGNAVPVIETLINAGWKLPLSEAKWFVDSNPSFGDDEKNEFAALLYKTSEIGLEALLDIMIDSWNSLTDDEKQNFTREYDGYLMFKDV